MSGQTPGQAAYEAFWTRESGFVVTPWGEALSPSEREAWQAAAQAAIDVFLAGDSVSAESIREALAAQEQPAPEPEMPVITPAVVRPAWGDVIVLAVGEDFPADRARELQDLLAGLNQGVTVTTVRGVDALRTWEPQPAPGLATVDLHRWYAVINQSDGSTKVIGHTDDGLGYYDSVDEWEAKNS